MIALIRGVFTAMVSVILASTVAAGPTSHTLTVVSYNILHGTDMQGRNSLTSQGLALAAMKADFIGLQEVDMGCSRSQAIDQVKALGDVTNMHPAFAAHFDYQGGQYGVGLLSRFPLTDVRNGRISLINKDGTTETRALLSATATLDNGSTVVMASVHMGLSPETRRLQAKEILQQLDFGDTPVILTGDFNAEPGSEEIALLKSQFRNAGTDKPFTFSTNEPVKTIDYIMVRGKHVATGGYEVLADVAWSDHLPIRARVTVRR